MSGSATLGCEDTLLQSLQTISMGTSEDITRVDSLFPYVQCKLIVSLSIERAGFLTSKHYLPTAEILLR